jgi:hypothetical protein
VAGLDLAQRVRGLGQGVAAVEDRVDLAGLERAREGAQVGSAGLRDQWPDALPDGEPEDGVRGVLAEIASSASSA